jgi:hypothetical protein
MTTLLWERYTAWTAADIVAMKGVAQENRHLDFKLLSRPDFGHDDQSQLARAVSGFANAEGGVVVWGVDARRDPKDEYIDQVVDTPGVGNPRQILSRLNGLTADATAPGLDGLDHRIIEGVDGLPSFVATFVPEGQSGPYMAMLKDARHRYFRRIGSAFTPMDHSMVADMFGRRPRGALKVGFEKTDARVLSVHMINSGRGPVHAPYLLLQLDNDGFVVAPHSPYGMVRTPKAPSQATPEGFVGGADVLILPGLTLTFSVVRQPEIVAAPVPIRIGVNYRFGGLGLAEERGGFIYNFKDRAFTQMVGPAVEGRPRL